MSSPFIPYGRQTITQDDIDAVQSVLSSAFLTQGPEVPRFEHKFSKIVGCRYSVATNSATSALHLACLAFDLSPSDFLWTSPITFVASANCARYCGANVDFVDIDPSTGLISMDALEAKLELASSNNTLPKVIVPVHLAGTSCPMYELSSLVRPYGIKILEDASHAVGARYLDEAVGSCRYSDASVFSFHPVKIITSAEGGMFTTNDQTLANSVSLNRSHGIVKDSNLFDYPSPGPWAYEQQYLGFNYRMTDIQAALGSSQLNRLSDIVHERNRLWKNYQLMLQDLPLKLLSIPSECYSSVHLAVVILDHKDPSYHRKIFESLRSLGIGVQLHYSPVHLQPYYRSLGFRNGDFPNSEIYSTSAFSLPLFPGLTSNEQNYVVQSLHNLL